MKVVFANVSASCAVCLQQASVEAVGALKGVTCDAKDSLTKTLLCYLEKCLENFELSSLVFSRVLFFMLWIV